MVKKRANNFFQKYSFLVALTVTAGIIAALSIPSLQTTSTDNRSYAAVTNKFTGYPTQVDLRANGSNGPVTIRSKAYTPEKLTLSWTSQNATYCSFIEDKTGLLRPTKGSFVPRTEAFGSHTYTIACCNPPESCTWDSVEVRFQ